MEQVGIEISVRVFSENTSQVWILSKLRTNVDEEILDLIPVNNYA